MRQVSDRMTMPLTFATFYTCGIKQFTNFTQRDCVNILLQNYDFNSIDVFRLSSSVCSNYANGKSSLRYMQYELSNLTVEQAMDRLNKIGIRDFSAVSNALIILVKHSFLSDKEKGKLIKCYELENELTFIATVFLRCMKEDNLHPLSSLEIETLMGYINDSDLTDVIRNDSPIIVKENDEHIDSRFNMEETRMSNNKIFIVHGRNEGVRDKVELLLRRAGLDPIILAEQASRGMTIIEKIESNSDVAFSVVLYTGCDEGKLKEESVLHPRARQNVVFEHGYMVAKLGRDKVVALTESGVEQPGDLAGIIYVSLSENDWERRMLKELEAGGLQINWSKI